MSPTADGTIDHHAPRTPVSTDAEARAERDRRAYDEDRVWERSHAWHVRVIHVMTSPNTSRHEETFRGLLADAVGHGGRGLDIGCGDGRTTRGLIDLGASYALGIDVSETEIAKARQLATPDEVEFRLGGVQDEIEGRFDLIFGRSILHHIDFREVLPRLATNNLAPDGRMVFMEPLSHPLTLAFHKIVRSAHTEDERPLTREDLTWMQATFPGFELVAVNLTSFATGIVSSFVSRNPDNKVMQLSDRLDEWLARRSPRLRQFYRQGIISLSSRPS